MSQGSFSSARRQKQNSLCLDTLEAEWGKERGDRIKIEQARRIPCGVRANRRQKGRPFHQGTDVVLQHEF